MRIEPNQPVKTAPVNTAHEAPSVQPQAGGKAQEAKAKADAKAENEQMSLGSVVDKMNKTLHIFNPSLQFEVAEGHRIIVKVVDTVTGEVIKQIPPEELVETYRKLAEALGVLIDRKV